VSRIRWKQNHFSYTGAGVVIPEPVGLVDLGSCETWPLRTLKMSPTGNVPLDRNISCGFYAGTGRGKPAWVY